MIVYISKKNPRTGKPNFSRKFCSAQEWTKWSQNVQNGFFDSFFPQKYCHYFFLELLLNESQLHALTNATFEKIVVFELCVKMLSVSQITKFFNQLYLKKKVLNQIDFGMQIQIQEM